VAEHDDLAAELKREWFGRRAQQIHEELRHDFNRFVEDLHPGRMRAILAAAGHPDAGKADLAALAAANTAATAEGVLAAVAIYLARQEANTPETR
jgi:Mrp family chromosome partitioning ATPase